jgi:hypothetical protein
MQHVALPQPSFNRHHFFTGLKYAFLPLYCAVVLSLLIDQTLNSKIETILRSSDGLSQTVWFWGGLSLLSSLFFPVFLTLFCCFFITEKIKGISVFKLFPFLKNNFEMTFLESIRAWAFMFLWFFALFLPLIYKFISYALTPFIVIYSKKYAKGEVDALKASEYVSREFFLKLFFLLLTFYILLPSVSTLIFDEFKVFRFHPVPALLVATTDTIFIYIIHFLILTLFFNSVYFKGELNGTNV